MFKVYFNLLFVFIISACDSNRHSNKSVSVISNVNHLSTDSLIYNNDTIALYKIDSITYFTKKVNAYESRDSINQIKDFEQAKGMLKGRVTFGGWNDKRNQIDSLVDGQMIAFIQFDNLDTINSNVSSFFSDNWFVAYYPEQEIILFEGGHSSDFSVDLRNSRIGADLVGNPMYIVSSPSKEYRLNGWFPGQECTSYFIERRVHKGYEKLIDIPLHVGNVDFLLCNLDDKFWISDSELFFRNNFYAADERQGFFKLKIK